MAAHWPLMAITPEMLKVWWNVKVGCGEINGNKTKSCDDFSGCKPREPQHFGRMDQRMIYVHICTGEDNDGKDNENIDDKITNDDLEMSVAELFPNENCPRPGTDPSECSSDDLLTRSCTSGG